MKRLSIALSLVLAATAMAAQPVRADSILYTPVSFTIPSRFVPASFHHYVSDPIHRQLATEVIPLDGSGEVVNTVAWTVTPQETLRHFMANFKPVFVIGNVPSTVVSRKIGRNCGREVGYVTSRPIGSDRETLTLLLLAHEKNLLFPNDVYEFAYTYPAAQGPTPDVVSALHASCHEI